MIRVDVVGREGYALRDAQQNQSFVVLGKLRYQRSFPTAPARERVHAITGSFLGLCRVSPTKRRAVDRRFVHGQELQSTGPLS